MTLELQEVIEKARTAALACHTLTVELAAFIEESRELKANLSLELQATRDQRLAEHQKWREFMAELHEELNRIKADFRTDAALLHLIEPEKAGDPEYGRERTKTDTNQDPSESRLLAGYVSHTRGRGVRQNPDGGSHRDMERTEQGI